AGADTSAVDGNPSRCIDLIDTHCRTVNPFDTSGGCNGNPAYNDERKTACEMGTNLGDCAATIALVCPEEPFNADLCYAGDTYEEDRVDSCNDSLNFSKDPKCITDNIVDVYCNKDRPNAGTNMRCDDWVVAECGANPFDTLCGDGYTLDRRDACLGGDIDNSGMDRCPNLIDTYCTASPFDVSPEANGKCLDMKYNMAREAFIANCRMEVPTVIGCDTAKISATSTETVKNCIANPFLAGCLDSSGDPLPILSEVVMSHCTTDANIFQMGCNDHVGSARTDLVAQCVPSEEATPAKCGTIIVSGGISVSQCIEDPFLPECGITGITEFAGFATGKCVADADNSLGRLFSPLCPDSNLLELRRNSYCRASNNLFKMNCDGRGSVDATRVDAVATCIAFGL
ncbi:MAG: hypothetical protein K8953_06970, partial [Proteobacteria bacterium]|nr:hypothetical protein [Pseudomonadota bacterium]